MKLTKWICVAGISMCCFATACGGGEKATAETQTEAQAETAIETQTETISETQVNEGSNDIDAIKKELKEKYDITEPSSFVRGDTTGKWRICKVANATPPTEYAVDYARAYMTDGDVHFVVNFSLNTTTMYNLLGNIVEAKTTEYVDKEEHDASVIGAGMVLTDNYYNIETGEQITTDADENAGTVSEDDLIATVSEAISGQVGENENITDVAFDSSDLKITIDLSAADTNVPLNLLAISRISSVTDAILALDDQYYNTWETVTLDFGDVGKATLDKSMVKDQGYGKFFDFEDDILQ